MSVSTPFLHTIQPVSEDRPAEAVAREILVLIRSEYRYTIADLCRMFCCERQWIEDFFVPNIPHVHQRAVKEQHKDCQQNKFQKFFLAYRIVKALWI